MWDGGLGVGMWVGDWGWGGVQRGLTPSPARRSVPPAATRRRESEKSVEGDACGREEEGREEKQPLKVMPAPPPKENAWAKRSSSTAGRSPGSDSEQHSPSR